MQVGILDQSAVRAGHHPAESIRETVALAQVCEGYGYGRYWLAEHHASPAVAGSAPEVLLGALAVATRRIRIGSAGVMLPHYSALKVAECFRVLEALAPGGDRRTAFALNPLANEAADYFPAQVRDLLTWTQGEPLVVERLRQLAADLGLDEIAIVTTASTPDIRRESYRLLAQAAGLAEEHPAAAAA